VDLVGFVLSQKRQRSMRVCCSRRGEEIELAPAATAAYPGQVAVAVGWR
jgi:hypothetical protein